MNGYLQSPMFAFAEEMKQDAEIIGKVRQLQIRYDKNYNLQPKNHLLSEGVRILRRVYERKYQSIVRELRECLSHIDDPKAVPFFIGAGSTTYTYLYTIEDQRCAVILYGVSNPDSRISTDDFYGFFRKIIAGIISKDVSHIPQTLGYSLADQSIIMELASGQSIAENTTGGSNIFTDDELYELIKTVSELRNRGLCVDYHPDNLFYSKDDGFSIIDLCLQKNDSHKLYHEIMSLRFMLIGKKYKSLDPQQCATELEEKRKESLNMGLKILLIVKAQFPNLLMDFRNADQNEILCIGDSNLYAEFNSNNPYDREILEKAQKILS